MRIIATCQEMRDYSHSVRKSGSSVCLVPTMGALHCGHLSLLKVALGYSAHTVMSIFINPIQFGPAEDLDKYPRQLDRDCELADAAGCDALFIPSRQEIYPESHGTYVSVDNIAGVLCGASRPTHFRGVATIVLKLFNIVMPGTAVFGSKDAQQIIVIRRMVEDLNLQVRIIPAPTVREGDGLAMSSRNAYLSAQERSEASLIYRALRCAQRLYDDGERGSKLIKERIGAMLAGSSMIKPEYIEVVDTVQLKSLDRLDRPALIAAACRTAETGTRLIDNIVLGGDL